MQFDHLFCGLAWGRRPILSMIPMAWLSDPRSFRLAGDWVLK